MMDRLQGSWVALPTPMNEDHSIDYDGFRTLFDFHAEHGTSALLVAGSAGEVATLSVTERQEMIDVLTRHDSGTMPVFFNISSPTAHDSVALARFAQDHGADGVLITAPMYSLPPQEAILDYLVTVATAIDIPFALYNNPQRVAVTVRPETIYELSRIAPNFVADKEAVPSAAQVSRVAELTGGSLPILCCDNPGYGLLPTAVALGDGMANISGNLDPEAMANISRPLSAVPDVRLWREGYLRMLPLMRMCYALPNPVMVKALMNALGLPAGPVRPPLADAHGSLRSDAIQLVKDHHLADRYGIRPQ